MILRAGATAGGDPISQDLRVFLGVDEETACFLCGGPLRELPAVVWRGSTGEIAFHPRCATSFLLRLARDCWEIAREEEHR